MINIVAFTIAAVIWLLTWALGSKGVVSALIPVLIMVIAASIYTYAPLVKKTIHGEDS